MRNRRLIGKLVFGAAVIGASLLVAVIARGPVSSPAKTGAQPIVRPIGTYQCGLKPQKKFWLIYTRTDNADIVGLAQELKYVDEQTGEPATGKETFGYWGQVDFYNGGWSWGERCGKVSGKVFAQPTAQTRTLPLRKGLECSYPQPIRLELRWVMSYSAPTYVNMRFAPGRSSQAPIEVRLRKKGSVFTYNPRFCKPVPLAAVLGRR